MWLKEEGERERHGVRGKVEDSLYSKLTHAALPISMETKYAIGNEICGN